MNMKFFKKGILPLILIAGAIALSPSYSIGEIQGGREIEIRLEDIFIVVLGLVWIAGLVISRKKIKKPPLFFPILICLGAGLVSVFTNWIFGNLNLSRGFFYFLKEIEFFIFYFYIFYHIKTLASAKFLVKLWLVLGLANVSYVIYQLVTKNYKGGAYGYRPAAICEGGVFPTGAFFLLLFIFLFNIFLYYFLSLNISRLKKGFLGILSVSPMIGVFNSFSKTCILAGGLVLVLTLFLFILRERNLKLCLIALILVFTTGVLIFAFSQPLQNESILEIFSPSKTFYGFERQRLGVITETLSAALEKESYLLPIFGFGKGYVYEAHNQYVRNFIETGIIGSIAFLILIFAIIKKAFYGFLKNQDGFSVGLSAGLLMATLAMLFSSFATEPFIVVKVSEVYWFFAGLTLASLSLKREN